MGKPNAALQSAGALCVFIGLTMSCCCSPIWSMNADPPGDTPKPTEEKADEFRWQAFYILIAGVVVTGLGVSLNRRAVRAGDVYPSSGPLVVQRRRRPAEDDDDEPIVETELLEPGPEQPLPRVWAPISEPSVPINEWRRLWVSAVVWLVLFALASAIPIYGYLDDMAPWEIRFVYWKDLEERLELTAIATGVLAAAVYGLYRPRRDKSSGS